jgi:hypothetical protein
MARVCHLSMWHIALALMQGRSAQRSILDLDVDAVLSMMIFCTAPETLHGLRLVYAERSHLLNKPCTSTAQEDKTRVCALFGMQ